MSKVDEYTGVWQLLAPGNPTELDNAELRDLAVLELGDEVVRAIESEGVLYPVSPIEGVPSSVWAALIASP